MLGSSWNLSGKLHGDWEWCLISDRAKFCGCGALVHKSMGMAALEKPIVVMVGTLFRQGAKKRIIYAQFDHMCQNSVFFFSPLFARECALGSSFCTVYLLILSIIMCRAKLKAQLHMADHTLIPIQKQDTDHCTIACNSAFISYI